MVGVTRAITMAELAVPHCNTMARNKAIAVENAFGPQRLRVVRAWRGLQCRILRLTPIANAITLVKLLVPINGHSIDGRVDREVVVTCSDPLRHEIRRLTDLH